MTRRKSGPRATRDVDREFRAQVAQMTAGMPCSLNTFASLPPPPGSVLGVKPRFSAAFHAIRTTGSSSESANRL